MSKGLLVVSFGTSVAETRIKTIEALEKDLAAAVPERKAYRAWTSSIIRRKLRHIREKVSHNQMPPLLSLEIHYSEKIIFEKVSFL